MDHLGPREPDNTDPRGYEQIVAGPGGSPQDSASIRPQGRALDGPRGRLSR